jgi:hypothetical protein
MLRRAAALSLGAFFWAPALARARARGIGSDKGVGTLDTASGECIGLVGVAAGVRTQTVILGCICLRSGSSCCWLPVPIPSRCSRARLCRVCDEGWIGSDAG